MPRTNKPHVNVNGVANHYSNTNQRIIEYAHANGGGLISFTAEDDGRLVVELYRHDPTVEIRLSKADGAGDMFKEKDAECIAWLKNRFKNNADGLMAALFQD